MHKEIILEQKKGTLKEKQNKNGSLKIKGKTFFCVFRDLLSEYDTESLLNVAASVCIQIFRHQNSTEDRRKRYLIQLNEDVERISYFKDINGDWNFRFHVPTFIKRIYPKLTSVLHFEIEIYQIGQGNKVKAQGDIPTKLIDLERAEKILEARRSKEVMTSKETLEPIIWPGHPIQEDKLEMAFKNEDQNQKNMDNRLKEFENSQIELRKSQLWISRLHHKLAVMKLEKSKLQKRLKAEFGLSLERENKLKHQLKLEKVDAFTQSVLSNIAQAHNKIFESKVQQNGGLLCPVSQEHYRLDQRHLILKAKKCGHFLSMEGFRGMEKSAYGVSCCYCRKERDSFSHVWAETMMANQKYFMDLFLHCKATFDKSDSLNVTLVSKAKNVSDSAFGEILTKEADYEPEIIDDFTKALKNPSVENFYEFFMNYETPIPNAKSWFQGDYEALRKPYTPVMSQEEIQSHADALQFAEAYHASLNPRVLVSEDTEQATIERPAPSLRRSIRLRNMNNF